MKNEKSHIADAANVLLNEGKKFTNELYEQSLNKFNDVEKEMHEYSDQLLTKVKKNPLASVLIAGGVGFLLAKLFHK